MVSSSESDLWTLALDRPWIGPSELAEAVEREVARQPLDFRTRLLIRDSVEALRIRWGHGRLQQWLSNSPQREALENISKSSAEPPGFPSLAGRIMEPTRADTVHQFLRELGQRLRAETSVAVGGSVALILGGLLSRRTEDIDLVDEVPLQIRGEHELLENLAQRYGLRLAHFQSHFLPAGWQSRLVWLGKFDQLEVKLVDAGDIFLSKLFSAREKDRDDLRWLAGRLDKTAVVRRLLESAAAMQSDETRRKYATANWQILYGEALP